MGKFIRFGALNGTRYPKKAPGTFAFSGDFHKPPARKGIFAFIYPYSDSFLWAWKFKTIEGETEEEHQKRWNKFYREQKHIFEYDGPIWTHLKSPAAITNGSWYLIDTDMLDAALKKNKHETIGWLISSEEEYISSENRDEWLSKMLTIKDPYRRGLGGCVAVDSLEVFIEKKYLGRIK